MSWTSLTASFVLGLISPFFNEMNLPNQGHHQLGTTEVLTEVSQEIKDLSNKEIALATPKTIKVWINTFIPDAMVKDPVGRCFTGDNRGLSNDIHASSRTHQEIEFDVATLTKTIDWKDTGTTHKVDCSTGNILEEGKASTAQLTNGTIKRSGSNVLVNFKAAAKNPLLTGAPAIDLNITFKINPATREVSIVGHHDGFPAYEAYVTADGGAGTLVYSHDPRATGDTPSSLFPPMEIAAKNDVVKF
ncbi:MULTISPECIES: DUF3238 domain-containing protein [Calothrix]|uniref:DUF3238 domain-containing protein n=2 Tax=Calothrix TaxID=1186 RepID=A0ABR8AKX9_9CYAN|nr:MULTISPECIES: DUF3238 domain-containing protein [Calothrix]MBD2200190.1 DUF3238 domain-containing protein [Calothrix parietina FACHB-288]MBD2229155.1 DUF3238 domain-containing protein [Calothrix anomala FACHB-343]